MTDVICIGELFIDLVPSGSGDGSYLPSPGGAPGNVAVGLSKLGHDALMISRVGRDAFGRLLVETLQNFGVDASGVVLSGAEKVGLAVVTLDEGGDRSFMFYHDTPADQNMQAEDIQAGWFTSAKILHAGVLPLASPGSAAAQRRAMDLADGSGALISCDVNFRPALWDDPARMLRAGREMIGRSAIVKVSAEELEAVGGPGDTDAIVRSLWHDRLRLFSVTRGAEGAALYTSDGKHECVGYRVTAADTTGAGDAYAAAILSGLISGMEPARLLPMACAAGALAASSKGAMGSLPTREELAAFTARSP